MSRRKRHYVENGEARCGMKLRASDQAETDWKRVDCYQCQVRRFVAARRAYDKRKAAELARQARPVPLLEEIPVLPEGVHKTVLAFIHKYPLPPCSECNDAMRAATTRQWLMMLAQQVNWDFPHQGFGVTFHGCGLAHQVKGVASVREWPIIVNIGATDQSLDLNVEMRTLSGDARFIEVDGVNLLKPEKPKAAEPVVPHPQTEMILERLDGLEAQLERIITLVSTGNRESQARDSVIQKQLHHLASLEHFDAQVKAVMTRDEDSRSPVSDKPLAERKGWFRRLVAGWWPETL